MGKKGSQKNAPRIPDGIVLACSILYTLVVLVRGSLHEPGALFLVPGAVIGLTLLGLLAAWGALRFFPSTRSIPLIAIYLLYLLGGAIVGLAWDDEIFRILALLAAGPCTFLGDRSSMQACFPFISQALVPVFIIVALAVPMILMMLASVFRPNRVGIFVTSLGTALWYLAGFGALVCRIA